MAKLVDENSIAIVHLLRIPSSRPPAYDFGGIDGKCCPALSTRRKVVLTAIGLTVFTLYSFMDVVESSEYRSRCYNYFPCGLGGGAHQPPLVGENQAAYLVWRFTVLTTGSAAATVPQSAVFTAPRKLQERQDVECFSSRSRRCICRNTQSRANPDLCMAH